MILLKSASASAAVLLVLAVGPVTTLAQEGPPRISVTEGHLLAYFNESDDSPSLVGTLQHFSTWRYGSNFFFADVSGGPDLEVADTNLGVYLEYAPVLSLQRLGAFPGSGPLRDIGPTVQVNGGWTPSGLQIDRVFLEGVELAWSVPGFVVFNTQLLARQERGYHGSWQATWVYDLPVRLGPARGQLSGFMDVWRRTDGGEASTVMLAQPQLLVTLGSPDPGESFLQVGVEVEPSHDFPAREVRPGWNVAVSPVVRWVF
jgi:hypothetical protein